MLFLLLFKVFFAWIWDSKSLSQSVGEFFDQKRTDASIHLGFPLFVWPRASLTTVHPGVEALRAQKMWCKDRNNQNFCQALFQGRSCSFHIYECVAGIKQPSHPITPSTPIISQNCAILKDSKDFQVPNSNYQKLQIPSSKFQVPNTKFQIPSSKFQASNSKLQIPICRCFFPIDIWDLEFVIWNLWLGICDLEFVIWNLWLGICDLEFVTWNLWLGICDFPFFLIFLLWSFLVFFTFSFLIDRCEDTYWPERCQGDTVHACAVSRRLFRVHCWKH